MSRISQLSFHFAVILVGCLAFLAAPRVFALNESPQTFTLDGQLFQTGTTTPLADSNVVLKVQILDPGGTCLLYEETQTVSTSTTDGYFHINVGSATGAGKRTVNDPGRTMTQVFQNLTAISANSVPGQTCAGSSYTPSPGAVRYFRITVTPSSTNIADTLTPDIAIDSVPQALVAQSVQGLERSSILQTASGTSLSLTQANLEALFTTPAYTNLQSILAGNFISTDSNGANLPSYASTPGGVAAGDIWYDSVSNQIKYYNGSGVQTVGAGGAGISSLTMSSDLSVNGVVAGTISGGSGTIGIANITTPGKVSGSAITSGTISGSTGINSSGNLITTGTISGLTVQATNLRIYNGAHYVQLTAQAMSSDISFALPTADGISGQVLQTNGAGVLSWGAATTAGTISVGQGGTGTTSYANNQLIASNGTGTALVAATCPQYQVISFDASGNITCSNVSSLAGMILNGGNSTAGTISIGTNDNQALRFKTNNSTAMTISQNGNVGIGTATPAAMLDILGRNSGSGSAPSALNVLGGSGDSTGFGGVINLKGGPAVSSGRAGYITIEGGQDPSAALGGKITLHGANGGYAATPAGTGGSVAIDGGNAANGADGGDVFINGGAKSSSATNGDVILANLRGNVGIGTTSPNAILDVAGGINLTGTLRWSTQTAGLRDGWGLELLGSTSRPIQIPTGALLIGYDQSDATARGNGDLLVSGNVGIGISSPGQKLSVAGTIESTSGGFKFPDGTTQSSAAGAVAPEKTSGRLTLTSGTPITTSDITGASTIYFTPFRGNRISIYNGTIWAEYTFTEKSLALSGLTSDKAYDVFAYIKAGVVAVDLGTAWTDSTNRALSVTLQDGVYVNGASFTSVINGDSIAIGNGKYLGTIFTTGVNTTEDSQAKGYVWNYYHRLPKSFIKNENTQHILNNNTNREWNNSTALRAYFVIGVIEESLTATISARAFCTAGSNVFLYVNLNDVVSSSWMNVNTPSDSGFSLNKSHSFYPSTGQNFVTMNEREFSGVNCTLDSASVYGVIPR